MQGEQDMIHWLFVPAKRYGSLHWNKPCGEAHDLVFHTLATYHLLWSHHYSLLKLVLRIGQCFKECGRVDGWSSWDGCNIGRSCCMDILQYHYPLKPCFPMRLIWILEPESQAFYRFLVHQWSVNFDQMLEELFKIDIYIHLLHFSQRLNDKPSIVQNVWNICWNRFCHILSLNSFNNVTNQQFPKTSRKVRLEIGHHIKVPHQWIFNRRTRWLVGIAKLGEFLSNWQDYTMFNGGPLINNQF